LLAIASIGLLFAPFFREDRRVYLLPLNSNKQYKYKKKNILKSLGNAVSVWYNRIDK